MKPDMYPDFIEACHAVATIAGLKEGEKVCILTDRHVESEVVYALFATAKLRRSQPYVCMVDDFEEWKVPEVVAPAVLNADVVFHAWPAANGVFGRKMRREKGARWISFGDIRNLDAFCSEAIRFPAPLLSTIVKQTWKKIDHGQNEADVRITDTKGTDLSLKLSRKELDKQRDDPRWQGRLLADFPGANAHIPLPHGPNLMRPSDVFNDSVNGVVCYDSIVGFGGAYTGNQGDSNFVEPVRVFIKDGLVQKCEGGWEAGIMGALASDGGKLAEIGLGFNPKVPSYGGRATGMAGSSRSGSLHVATSGKTGEHMDGCLFRATVVIDGKTIVDRGHLTSLDDTEVKEMAESYRTVHEGGWLFEANEERELQRYR
jgi:hypothetical protein